MEQVNTDYLISAFENGMDWDKVDEYAERLIIEDIYHECPAIQGFYRILDENDIGTPFIRHPDLEGDVLVSEEHMGFKIWVVTNGHHRSFAFRKAYAKTGILVFKGIDVTPDYSCFVTQQELENYEQ